MRFWTAQADPAGRTRLVPEGFCLGALILGPLWFVFARAWIPAALLFAAEVALLVGLPALPGPAWRGILPAAEAVLAVGAAASAHDLVRWSWQLRGFRLVDVVAARDRASAWQRLLDRRPDLAPEA
jgi:hypothetical protein